MFDKALNHTTPSTRLHTLPNETLIDIASFLSISELRQLSKVNQRLNDFVQDYSKRYRNNGIFWALPNEILLEVVRHLDCQKDRSRLARSCSSFYVLVTECIFRHDVRYNSSSLLNFAAKRNLKAMTRRMLRLDVDLETRSTTPRTASNKKLTPLATAALYGHSEIAEMLLKKGATQFIAGSRVPLIVSILAGHEALALLLYRNLPASVVCFENHAVTVLQMASIAKMARLVEHCLNHRNSQSQRHLDDEHVHNLSSALVRMLLVDFSDEDLLRRQTDEHAFQIVLMLLRHGASPDVRIQIQESPDITARIIASRHPDPRIRNLLSANMHVTELVKIRPIVGRLWMTLQGGEALTPFAPRSDVLLPGGSSSANLVGAVRKLRLRVTDSACAGGIMRSRINYEEIPLNALDIAAMVRRENCGLEKSLDLHPLELTMERSFPQLACPKIDTQSASKDFWARRPVMHSTLIPDAGDICAVPRAATQVETASDAEPFPQLTRNGTISNDIAKDIWASFSRSEVSQHTNKSYGAPPVGVDQAPRQVHVSRKQRKWMPLVL